MAALDKKRSLPPKVAAMQARKRRRLDDEVQEPESRPTKGQKTKLKVDSLAWKTVPLPDRLEDYEGFYGMEEIEGIDVVRDEKTGSVSLRKRVDAGPPVANMTSPDISEDETSGEEFAGLSDEPAELEAVSTKKSAKAIQKAKAKEPKAKQSAAETSKKPNGAFQILSTADEDDGADVSAWRPLKLSPDVLSSLSKLKFSSPTSIQKSAIPEILAGHDVIGKASTGSGKTLAFGIPILERWLEVRTSHASGKQQDGKTPLALILSPTRELAHQLEKHLAALFSNAISEGPSIATLTGGLSMQKQQRLLKHADIIIGTPGRLWEVISEGQGIMAALKKIQFLVVDEADRLLSEGHFKEVEEILNALDREETNEDGQTHARQQNASSPSIERQTLVFSATFDRSLQHKLASKSKPSSNLLTNKESMEYLLSKLNFRSSSTPKFIDVNPINPLATNLKESLIECAGTEKDLYLYTLLLLNPKARTLVFTNSVSAVRRITPFLQNLNVSALALHSGMPQKARLRSVERFTASRSSTGSVLVATDVAARGLDIANVQLVIHYHLPRAADTYVHRSGRTARAGQTGSSILICAPEEVAGVRRLVAKVHSQAAPSSGDGEAAKQGYYIRTLDLDRRIISRLKPRASLAKRLADTTTAKEKRSKEDDFMRAAAEELGVDYDSETFEAEGGKGRHGRGSGRKKKEREAKGLSKAEVGSMRAELKGLLSQRVNVGVSERYLTAGGVDVDELLKQQEDGAGNTGREFLGSVQDLGVE